MFPGLTPASPTVVAAAAVGRGASHAVSYRVTFVGERECERSGSVTLMVEPDRRVVVLHVTIVLGGFAIAAIGAPIGALLVLVLAKTASAGEDRPQPPGPPPGARPRSAMGAAGDPDWVADCSIREKQVGSWGGSWRCVDGLFGGASKRSPTGIRLGLVLLGMADDKEGREKQADDAERRQREREVEEARDRADEAEPMRTDSSDQLGDLDAALETLDYPTTTADLVAAVGDYEVETQRGWDSLEDVLTPEEDRTYNSAEDVRRRIQGLIHR